MHLNDASFTFHAESSEALGFGFRCGFLGLLHLEIVQERLERESGVEIIQTAPNVTYEVLDTDGNVLVIERPAELPEPNFIDELREPMVRCQLLVPPDCIGAVMKLAIERRGRFKSQEHLGTSRVILVFDMPLSEIVFDFYDLMKSATRGYGTLDYELTGFEKADLVKMRVLVSGTEVDALSVICHRDVAQTRGREILQSAAQGDPASAVRGRPAGRDRRQDHRARDDFRDAQERDGQVLRRRYHAQAQAAREAEEGQEAHAPGRQRVDPAGSVPRRAWAAATRTTRRRSK